MPATTAIQMLRQRKTPRPTFWRRLIWTFQRRQIGMVTTEDKSLNIRLEAWGFDLLMMSVKISRDIATVSSWISRFKFAGWLHSTAKLRCQRIWILPCARNKGLHHARPNFGQAKIGSKMQKPKLITVNVKTPFQYHIIAWSRLSSRLKNPRKESLTENMVAHVMTSKANSLLRNHVTSAVNFACMILIGGGVGLAWSYSRKYMIGIML